MRVDDSFVHASRRIGLDCDRTAQRKLYGHVVGACSGRCSGRWNDIANLSEYAHVLSLGGCGGHGHGHIQDTPFSKFNSPKQIVSNQKAPFESDKQFEIER